MVSKGGDIKVVISLVLVTIIQTWRHTVCLPPVILKSCVGDLGSVSMTPGSFG